MTKMAVHNGVFHADEVFGVAFMLDTIDDLEIIRTGDEEVLKSCEIVADVGGGKYDHHQADKVLRTDGIPYCAFGLLWQDFGIKYLQKQFPALEDPKEQQAVVDKLAYEFITQIDAGDNGVDVNTYTIPVTTISSVISSFMPYGGTTEEVEEGFKEAVAFARRFFYKQVRKAVGYYFDRTYIKTCLETQPIEACHLLVLEETVGWKEPLVQLDTEEKVYFVVFEDLSGSWRVQTVPKALTGFAARYDLPSTWAGLREDELSKATGIEGCIFCHPSLFICGNQTKEGAIAMAKLAIQILN